MKIEVIAEFTDKDDMTILHKIGDVVDFDDDRAISCINRGLAKEIIVNQKPKKKKEADNGRDNDRT